MLLDRVEVFNAVISILIISISIRYIQGSGCDRNGNKLTCTGLDLTNKRDIPANNVENIVEIEFDRGTIPLLESRMLSHFIDATELWMYKNQIQTIEPGAISSLKNLEILSLMYNELTKIDKNYFVNMTHLSFLDLGNNRIEIISDDAFEGLISLKSLDLRHNRIKSLSAGCFKGLSNLLRLYMHNNLLSKFENGLFNDLKSLDSLDFDNNNLEFINECSFSPLRVLRRLFMNNNKLTYLNADKFLKALPALNTIDLNKNQWYCNVLSDMLPKFIKRGVALDTNVFGIPCLNKTVPDSIRNKMANEDCVIVNNVTDT